MDKIYYRNLIESKENLEISLTSEESFFIKEDLDIFKKNLKIFLDNNSTIFYSYKYNEIKIDLMALEVDAVDFLRDQIH